MPVEALDTALALRRRAVAQARQHLAASTQASAASASHARALERQIEAETERASDPGGSDRLVEAFAAWLPGARHAATQARAAQDRQDAETSRLRAELTACRIGLESVEALIAQRESAREQARDRAAQRELDEIAQRRAQCSP